MARRAPVLSSSPQSRRARLLAGSALCGATLFFAAAAQAQTLPGIPAAADIKVSAGGTAPVITAPDTKTLDVDLNASRTVINWASFHVSGQDKVAFHFEAGSDIVLNKSPTQVKVDAGGQVVGDVGGATGGNIWFYSPQGVVISPGAVMTAGNFVFARGDGIVDMDFLDATAPLDFLRGVSDSLIQIDTITSATSASINAAGDLVLSASSGDLAAATVLAAGTATVTTSDGAITIGEVTAGGAATVTATGGDLTLAMLNAGGHATAAGSAAVSVTNASSASGDILLTAATGAELLNATAHRDIKVEGVSASLGAATAGRDVFVTATTGSAGVTGVVSAGDDIEVTATSGSVAASGGSLTATGAGATGGDAHVLARSTGGAVTVGTAKTQGTGGAKAGDVTIDAATSAALTTGASTQDIVISGASASLGSGTAARSVFVTATTGTAGVTGVVSAGDDIEVTATSGSVAAGGAALTSTGDAAQSDAHVLARSTGGSVAVGSAETQGVSSAAGDVTLEAAASATLGSGQSTKDIVVSGTAASLGSGAATHDVFVTATTGNASVTGSVSAGDDIEVTATSGSVTAASGSLTATGADADSDAHVLARSTSGSASVGSAATQGTTSSRRGDITVEGATSASLGSGQSVRDIRVSGPAASLGSGSARRDVFVTATTGSASVTGAVSAGDDIEVTATTGSVTASGGSLTSTGVAASDETRVLAQSTGGSVSVGAASTQGTGGLAGDVTVDGATGASLGSGASTRDIFVLGPSASLGSATATRDVFVTATTGPASVTGVVSAGDDIEVTSASGDVTASGGSLTATGQGAADDAHVLARSTSGAVTLGSAATQGVSGAKGDVTVEAATTAVLGSAASVRDVRVSGPSATLGSGSASRDVFVTATTGNASVTGSVSAGDDIEVTSASGSVTAGGGSLTSTGMGAADDAHVLVQALAGAVNIGSATTQGAGGAAGDVTIDAATTATATGALRSSQDVVLRATSAVTAGGSTIIAGRDVAASSNGGVTLGSARAGDDLALRALTGRVTAIGDLQSGTTQTNQDPAGAADALAGATLTGHDLDIRAMSVAVTGDTAAGRTPGNGETLDSAQLASDVMVAVTDPDGGGVAALRLATGGGKAVTAHGDIVLKGENVAGATIQTGDAFAGRDLAVHSVAAGVSMRSARAGDDVVLRAPGGLIEVTGDVQAGRNVAGATTTDAAGAGDDLNTALPFVDFDGSPGTVFKVVGFDVSIVSQAVRLTGATAAGREPSTVDPDTAGPVDATTSDVRIETRIPLTPVIGLAPNIELGAVTATRDLQIDSAKAVVTGDLKAGRDIAVLGRGQPTPGAASNDHSGAGVTIGSAHAGDDALAFSIYGRAQILGGVTSGAPFLRLTPTTDRNIDGATEAADQLAIYLRYFDLDDASTPYVLPGGVIHIAGQGVTVGGNLAAVGAGSDVRLRSSLDIDVSGATTAGRFATFQTDTVGGGAVKVGAVTAGQDVLLEGLGVQSTGIVASTNSDVAVRSRDGAAIALAGASAGDDVVLRTTGQVTLSGPVTTGGAADSFGLGDMLRITDGTVVLEGQAYDLAGHDVDITGASITASGSMTAVGAESDVRVQSPGAITLAAATAGRDVLVDGGATVTTGVLSAGRDVGVRSTADAGTVTVGGATAGDDVVIRAKGDIVITGALSSAGGGSDSAAPDQAGDLMFGVAKSGFGGDFDLAGRMIDVRTEAGSILATGAVSAADDARVQTAATTGGSVKVDAVAAGRDVLLDGASVEATGTLASTSDVAVRARDGGAITLAGVTAGDDLVVRTTGLVALTGAVVTGGGTDAVGLGDTLRSLEGVVTLEGVTYDLIGADVDIMAGSMSGAGSLSAASDVRVRSAGTISLGAVTAGRDVMADGGGAVTTGLLVAGRDVAVRSTGDGAGVTVGGATAGDDVVIRAKGAIRVTGPLNAGTGADSTDADQAGDLIFAVDKSSLAGALDLVGRTVDLRSSAGSIEVTGAVVAATDARFQTQGVTGGSVKVAAVTAGRDILLDGGGAAGSVGATATGTLMASEGDVAVRARDGSGIRVVGVSARDDVALRATGMIMSTGTVATTGGVSTRGLADRLTEGSESGRLSVGGMTFDLNTSDIEVVGGGVNILRTSARGSARIKAGAVSLNGGAAVGIDILIDSDTSLTVGDLSATGDIALRSRNGSLTVDALTAGDDVVLRAAGRIVTGTLRAGAMEHVGSGDQLFGADSTSLGGDFSLIGGTIDLKSSGGISMGAADSPGDVRLQATGGEVGLNGLVTAGRDILADGSFITGAGSLSAGRDVALRGRSGGVTVGSVSAGDDLVIRAAGDVVSSGELKSGQGADAAGVGDRLLTVASGTGVFGTSPDGAGGVIDIGGGAIRLGGPIQAAGGAAHLRLHSTGMTTLGDATLSGDIAIDADGAVVAGALNAGRDLAVRSTDGSITIGAATAGDDIVLRAARQIASQGALKAGQGAEADGLGDRLYATSPTSLGGELDLSGGNVDVASASGDVSVARVTAAGDVRIHAAAGQVRASDVEAGRDVLLDGASVDAGALKATRDIAVRATSGALRLASGAAGDDIVLRAQGDVTVTGALNAAGGADRAGAGDRLLASDASVADLTGRNVDIASTGGGVSAEGALSAADDVRLQAARSVTTSAGLRAGRDLRLQAGSVSVTGDVSAGRDVRLQAEGDIVTTADVAAGRDAMLDGASVSAGALRAGRDIAVRGATGGLNLGAISAGDDVVLRAAQDITVNGAVSAQGGADGEGAADELFAADPTSLAGDLDLAGANIDVAGRAAVTLAGAATAGRDARFQTRGDAAGLGAVSLGSVTAGGDILADGGEIRASGELAAGRDVALRARAGAVELASASAGDDIAIRAAQAVTVSGALTAGTGANAQGAADRLVAPAEGGMILRLVDPLAAKSSVEGFALEAGDIDIKGGDVALAGDVQGANIRLEAASRLSVASATASDTIFARTGDLSLGGAWRAATVRLEVTASRLALGEGAAGSDGLALSSEQLGRIEASTVQIFLGDTSSDTRGGDLAIGTLSIDTAKVRDSLELYAGALSDVVITGVFAPSGGGANTTTLRIGAPNAAAGWTPRSIKVVADGGGSIGYALTTGGRTFTDVRAFHAVELNAKGDILMGYQDFIDRLSTTAAASVPGAVKTLIAPQSANGPRILVTAGSLTLRADGKVAQQDTGGLLGSTPTGLYILGEGTPQLLLGRTSDTPGLPEFIELNGALTSGTTIMTGDSVSLASGIAFDGGVSPSSYYRLNTCAILQQGACTPSNGHPTIAIPPEQLTGLTLEDRTAAAGAADPTVASATNEEVWKDPN